LSVALRFVPILPEISVSVPSTPLAARTVDLHVGYSGTVSKFDYYIQGGPAFTAVADVDGTETELSGKLGGTYNVSQNLGIYGEFSGVSNGDEDNNYGTKLGAKYSF